LLQELNKINNIVITEFDTNSFYRALDVITSKKEWVNENIDKEIFEKLKDQEYNKLTSPSNIQSVFLNELRHEQIGQYNDLDIDGDLFLNHNQKYKIEKEILESINPDTEKELIEFFFRNIRK